MLWFAGQLSYPWKWREARSNAKNRMHHHRERALAEVNWAHERYRCIYLRQIQSRGMRICARVRNVRRFSNTRVSPRFVPAYYHVPASKQNQRTERVIRLTVHTCALCIYRKYRTGTYSAERRGRTVVKRMNTWGRRGTRGPTLCTRRESMRVQVRKSTVVRRTDGGSVEKEKREMAWPKVKPNSFSVRLEAADSLLISLSRVSSGSSLSAHVCACVFSLCILYKSMRLRMMLSYAFLLRMTSASFERLCTSCMFLIFYYYLNLFLTFYFSNMWHFTKSVSSIFYIFLS